MILELLAYHCLPDEAASRAMVSYVEPSGQPFVGDAGTGYRHRCQWDLARGTRSAPRFPLAQVARVRLTVGVNAALETLMLAFTGENGLAVPSHALFLGAQPHPALTQWPDVCGWQPLKPLAAAWDGVGLARVDRPTGRYPLVLVQPGKSRDETLAWLARAREHLEPGGRLLVAMPNTAGAARFEKALGYACGNIASLQKHKCRAFHAVEDGKWREEIFAEWRALGGRRVLSNTKFVVEPGVFSVDHIDPGSAFLAAHLPATLRGDVADLGAGWGFLSDVVLQRCPKVGRLDLFEADARALACARANLAGHAREIHFHWHDVCEGLPGSYDAIVMNPPFHAGQATHVDLGRAFLKTAAAALRRGGKFYLVANRQLPYEAVLETCGLAWRNAGEDKTYKLLFAERR